MFSIIMYLHLNTLRRSIHVVISDTRRINNFHGTHILILIDFNGTGVVFSERTQVYKYRCNGFTHDRVLFEERKLREV